MSAGHHDEVIPKSLECADKVFLFSKNEKQIKKIALKSEKFSICSGTEELLKILPKELVSDTHIICLSNGSFGQIHQEILESF
jgi:UDP-N-acetylmuramate-alanine ligase